MKVFLASFFIPPIYVILTDCGLKSNKLCVEAEKNVTDSEQLLREVTTSYNTLISWAELYDTASFEKKKMIVNCLINRVDVYRGYKLKIDFNFDYQQFLGGLDCIEAA